MPVIILCSTYKKSILFNALNRGLSNYGNVICISNNIFTSTKGKPNFLLYKTESMENIHNTRGIVLFDEKFKSRKKHINIEKNTVNNNLKELILVFSSSNRQAINALNGERKSVVSCGTSGKDTFCISSIDMESATISLQREVVDINGVTHEPHEFKVELTHKISQITLLNVCATLMLCGVTSENGYRI